MMGRIFEMLSLEEDWKGNIMHAVPVEIRLTTIAIRMTVFTALLSNIISYLTVLACKAYFCVCVNLTACLESLSPRGQLRVGPLSFQLRVLSDLTFSDYRWLERIAKTPHLGLGF